jgi:hypothetical protein
MLLRPDWSEGKPAPFAREIFDGEVAIAETRVEFDFSNGNGSGLPGSALVPDARGDRSRYGQYTAGTVSDEGIGNVYQPPNALDGT